MSKDKLLKEAIADAKAIKEAALANARSVLEEAFMPKVQSMISNKLQAEADDYDDSDDDAEEFDEEVTEEVEEVTEDTEEVTEEVEEVTEDAELEEEVEEVTEDTEEVTEEVEDVNESDLDLEAVIKELEDEDEMDYEDEEAEEEIEAEEEAEEFEDEDEEIDVESLLKSLTSEEDEMDYEDEEEVEESVETLKAEIAEYRKALKEVQTELNEVNLLNAKLLFANKIFKSVDLNESQKLKVIDTFDRAKTVREVKLVYSSIAESYVKPKATKKRKTLKENFASTASPSTKPSKKILNEGSDLKERMAKLANIKK